MNTETLYAVSPEAIATLALGCADVGILADTVPDGWSLDPNTAELLTDGGIQRHPRWGVVTLTGKHSGNGRAELCIFVAKSDGSGFPKHRQDGTVGSQGETEVLARDLRRFTAAWNTGKTITLAAGNRNDKANAPAGSPSKRASDAAAFTIENAGDTATVRCVIVSKVPADWQAGESIGDGVVSLDGLSVVFTGPGALRKAADLHAAESL